MDYDKEADIVPGFVDRSIDLDEVQVSGFAPWVSYFGISSGRLLFLSQPARQTDRQSEARRETKARLYYHGMTVNNVLSEMHNNRLSLSLMLLLSGQLNERTNDHPSIIILSRQSRAGIKS